MAIDRRDLLKGMTGALAAPLFPLPGHGQAHELFAAALREAQGDYAAAIFSLEEGIVSKVVLPARGHSLAVRPGTRDCIAFARRPGSFAVVFAAGNARQPLWFTASERRHFYGHGVFSPDGKLLYSTENDFAGRRGVIGVRDASDGYRQIGEFASGGIGPHDIALLGGGRTLVVANGGIETHPNHGRTPLNLDTMTPSIVYIDTRTGDLLERHELPRDLHQLSIRHLTVAEGGRVAFGCQHKGPRNERPMLIGFHRRGETLRLADIPEETNGRLKGYVGSVSADRSGELIAATSPKGGVALYFDATSQRFLGETSLGDACGAAARSAGGGFLLTSGSGALAWGRPDTTRLLWSADETEGRIAWDNHVVRL